MRKELHSYYVRVAINQRIANYPITLYNVRMSKSLISNKPSKPITDAMQRLISLPAKDRFNDYSRYTKADLLAIRMYQRAIAGSFQDSKEIIDRIEGRVTQVIAGDPDNPIKIDVATALDRAIRLHNDSSFIDGFYRTIDDKAARIEHRIAADAKIMPDCVIENSQPGEAAGSPNEVLFRPPTCGEDELP